MKSILNLAYGPHGKRNRLDLYLPTPASKPAPVVICLHGGGWHGLNKEIYADRAEPLTRRGFAVASVTYRLQPDWLCPTAIDDVQRAVRWLRHYAVRYNLDPNRFGGFGESAGAHLGSFLALTDSHDTSDLKLAAYSSRIQCMVDCFGPVDLPAVMKTASAGMVEAFLGFPYSPATEAAYRHASPYYRVGLKPPPFLIVHGTADTGKVSGQVSIKISERFYKRLKAAGGEVTLMKIKGAGHGFTGEDAERVWAAATVFFEKHLGSRKRKT